MSAPTSQERGRFRIIVDTGEFAGFRLQERSGFPPGRWATVENYETLDDLVAAVEEAEAMAREVRDALQRAGVRFRREGESC